MPHTHSYAHTHTHTYVHRLYRKADKGSGVIISFGLRLRVELRIFTCYYNNNIYFIGQHNSWISIVLHPTHRTGRPVIRDTEEENSWVWAVWAEIYTNGILREILVEIDIVMENNKAKSYIIWKTKHETHKCHKINIIFGKYLLDFGDIYRYISTHSTYKRSNTLLIYSSSSSGATTWL